MKTKILFIFLLFNSLFAYSQIYPTILPQTKYCGAGSTAHPTSYCVDATQCKSISGVTVCLQGTPTTTTNTPATITGYSCPNGGVLTGNACVTTGTTSAIPSYSCPTGATLSGTLCSQTITTPSTPVYSCPVGSTLSGSSCSTIITTTTQANITYSCDAGWTLFGNTCKQGSNYLATPVYSCGSGTLSGTNCTSNNSYPATLVGSAWPGGGTCPTNFGAGTFYASSSGRNSGSWYLAGVINGFYWYNYNKYPTSRYWYSCTVSLACTSGGTISGSTCLVPSVVAASLSYTCPSGGTLNGSLCEATSSVAASINYSCPAGYTLSGTSCSTSTASTSAATATYACPTGSSLSGTSCLTDTIFAATVSYSCPNQSDTLSGSNCITSVSVDATPTYGCLAGVLTGMNCIQSALPNGALMANFSCWSTATDYTCDQLISECSLYTANPACTEVGSATCVADSNGAPMVSSNPKLGPCIAYSRTFHCLPAGASTTTTTTTCNPVDMLGGLDWATASPSAADDFVNAATSQEFARQLVTYGYDATGNLSNLFHGSAMSCADGWIGLKNCCGGGGGGVVSNYNAASLMGNVAGSALGAGATYAAKWGAPYVYDVMMSNAAPDFLQSGIASMANGLQSYGSNPLNGVGAFGFGLSQSGAAGTFASASSSFQLGTSGVYFNPYALAASLAIQVVMNALSCSQEEKDLANLKGQNLCHYVGSYCSRKLKVLGVTIACLETTESYCCFNGLLGKGVNEGAHNQLGLSWGSAQSPNCAGLSVAQLQSLDLSGPAFAGVMEPFKAKVMSNFNNNAAARFTTGGSAQTTMTTTGTLNVQQLCLQKQLLDPTTVCP